MAANAVSMAMVSVTTTSSVVVKVIGAISSACITHSYACKPAGISKYLEWAVNGLVIVECLYSHSGVINL